MRYEKKGLFFRITPNFLAFRLNNWNRHWNTLKKVTISKKSERWSNQWAQFGPKIWWTSTLRERHRQIIDRTSIIICVSVNRWYYVNANFFRSVHRMFFHLILSFRLWFFSFSRSSLFLFRSLSLWIIRVWNPVQFSFCFGSDQLDFTSRVFLSVFSCIRVIINNGVNGLVYYSCGHIEHKDCYLDYHPSNVICLICGVVSNRVFFH